MTSDDLFTLLASPAARHALLTRLARVACNDNDNDNDKPIDRPCEQCGQHFSSGTFMIVKGRVTTITCARCEPLGGEQ